MIAQVLPRLRSRPTGVKVVSTPWEENKKRFGTLKRLGSGAFGAAYAGRLNKRSVIIKVARGGGSASPIPHALAIQAMANEVRILKKLQKLAFVPRLIMVGPDFFVQEDVQGISMLDLLDRKGLEAREILSVAVACAIMASKIHQEGVAHADLEARNILLTPSGVVIIDFGVSVERGRSLPRALAVGVRNYHQGMQRDVISLIEMIILAMDSETVPDNVRIILSSVIEKYRKILIVGNVTPQTSMKLAQDLLFALAQLGAMAKRGAKILRQKVKVIAV
jgi:predicted Ser/Thr protein kinase